MLYRAFFFFLNYWLILFDFGSYYTNFQSNCRTVIPTETLMTEAKAKIETQPVKVEAKVSTLGSRLNGRSRVGGTLSEIK